MNVPILLGNTYHLGHRPGADIIEKMGGLHSFMNWERNILTDSGGFQMVSLLKLAKITEQGVTFQSPHDASTMILTPEKSIQLQNQIGADIIMALDDVVSSTTTGPRVKEACERTVRWLDRCISAHGRKNDQNLFAIVQGGLDKDLRDYCLKELIKRDTPGYAIGGLSGGESKDQFWRVVLQCTRSLPKDKPRYLMGVGYPVDLVVCVCLGVDMFDCVYPSRTARFGTAFVRKGGVLQLKSSKFKNDFAPIDESCKCDICKKYTRAYLHTLAVREQLGAQLLTWHNIAYLLQLMKELRESILEGKLEKFVRGFMSDQFPKKDYPSWAQDALKEVGIELEGINS